MRLKPRRHLQHTFLVVAVNTKYINFEKIVLTIKGKKNEREARAKKWFLDYTGVSRV